MVDNDIKGMDYTDDAWESLYDAVDDTQFLNKDAQIIYDSLRHKLKVISFGDYLKRYIYKKAGLTEPFADVPVKEYQLIIKGTFSDNHTPVSFSETTAKLSALSKNWLTQQTVKRNVVFLLGFGLNMSVDDVNMFLTKALREQEINPKDPFEVICWYCYQKRYNYLKFEQLWSAYQAAKPDAVKVSFGDLDGTIGFRNTMLSLHDDDTLITYLAKLKATVNMSSMSYTARKHFEVLYDEARALVAELYNAAENDAHNEIVNAYIHKLSFSDRSSDAEKRQRIEELRGKRIQFTAEDITESDIEYIICSAIPKDRHGNLSPSKASKLNEQFRGKRFSRQHIGEILSGRADVTRFDLITLNFFIFSQKLDVFPNSKARYLAFYESMNTILEKCFLGNLYIQNPYECFILMCILSEDPLGTYADVWELSYNA